MKSRIIKVPNKAAYDLNGQVKLICTFDNSSVKIESYERFNYKIEWFKLGPNGSEEKQKVHVQWDKPVPVEILLSPLTSETEGIYKCVVSRYNHRHFQLVEIKLRGKQTQNINLQHSGKDDRLVW